MSIFRKTTIIILGLFFSVEVATAQQGSSMQIPYLQERAKDILEKTFRAHGFDKSIANLQNITVTLDGYDRWLGQGQSPEEPTRIRYYHREDLYDYEHSRYYSHFETRNDIELTHCSEVVAESEHSYYYNCLSGRYQELNADENPEFNNIILSRFPDPREYLAQAKGRSETVRWEGQDLVSGEKTDVISFVNADSTRWELYIGVKEKVLKKVRGPIIDTPRSLAVPVRTRYYDDYHRLNGVKIPYLRTKIRPTGSPYESRHTTFEVVEVKINSIVEESLFDQPEEIIPQTLTPSPEWSHQEVSGGVHFIEKVHSNFNAVFVEMEDFVVVFDAPIDDQLSKRVLEKISELTGGKPVRYVIASHFHYDHIGGLKEYVKQGAAVILPKGISSFVKEFASLSETETEVDEVENHISVSDDSRRIEIYNMNKNPHSEGMLFAYIPDAEAVIVADLFWKEDTGHLRPARLQTRLFYQKLISLKKNISTLIPLHFPLSKMEDLENAVELFKRKKEAITQ